MPSLLFLPDISGFTKFLHETEIQHSQHIIQELLEVIINANSIDLKIAEIEGDAIFFYKHGPLPSLHEILNQVRKMFIDFHVYIAELERDRVCDCGACKTAINLSLKFIVHYGEARESKIKDHIKLFGTDVIVAHRLLKNNVEEAEYALFSTQFMQTVSGEENLMDINWASKKTGYIQYEHLGEISYTYMLLTPLKSEVPPIISDKKAHRYKRPIQVQQEVFAPVSLIYNTIIDLSQRMNWTEGLRDIQYTKNEVPRIGAKHICLLPFGEVEIETVERRFKKGIIEYAEHATNMKIVKNATTFYILKETAKGTLVSFEFHYKPLVVFGRLINLFLRPVMHKSLSLSLMNLKHYCEQVRKTALTEQKQ